MLLNFPGWKYRQFRFNVHTMLFGILFMLNEHDMDLDGWKIAVFTFETFPT